MLIALATAPGCALFGEVKPVTEKSRDYGVMDLSRGNPDWKRLEPAGNRSSSEAMDLAFQSERTASIISVNSACRPNFESPSQTLREFTNLLFLGISDVTRREERDLTLQDIPALQTTISGKMNGETMTLRTVIVRKGPCVYDLMYVARPDFFAQNEKDFEGFVASLQLK